MTNSLLFFIACYRCDFYFRFCISRFIFPVYLFPFFLFFLCFAISIFRFSIFWFDFSFPDISLIISRNRNSCKKGDKIHHPWPAEPALIFSGFEFQRKWIKMEWWKDCSCSTEQIQDFLTQVRQNDTES